MALESEVHEFDSPCGGFFVLITKVFFLCLLIGCNIYYCENEGYLSGKTQLLRGMGSRVGIQRSLVQFPAESSECPSHEMDKETAS